MALDNVPWFIGGGAEHSPSVARLLGFAATQGATGIIQPGDLLVRALAVPGTAVRIGPGAATMYNRYPGATSQSYLARNTSDTNVEIPATGSGETATRYIILRITDPQFGGQAPADVVNGPYVEAVHVSSITNLPYPFVPLAKIVQPASTGTITQAMITDLREVANPRVKDVIRANPTVTGDLGLVLANTTTAGEQFPNGSAQDIEVPDWATRMIVRAEWHGVKYTSSSKYGHFWVEYGRVGFGYEAETQRFSWDTGSASMIYRTNWSLVDERVIPASWRGGSIRLWPQARVIGGSGGSITVDPTSGLSLSVRFLEVADPSTN